jgi:hypothetical protein
MLYSFFLLDTCIIMFGATKQGFFYYGGGEAAFTKFMVCIALPLLVKTRM